MKVLKHNTQNVFAIVDGKSVYMSTADGVIYKQFPVEHFKGSDYILEVNYSYNFLTAKRDFIEKETKKRVEREEKNKAQQDRAKQQFEKERAEHSSRTLWLRNARHTIIGGGEVVVYAIERTIWELPNTDSSDPIEKVVKFCFDGEFAKSAYDLISSLSVDFGMVAETTLFEFTLDEDVLSYTMYDDKLEEYLSDMLGNGKIMGNSSKEADYSSIEGAVIVVWSWEKYIGYSRKLRGLRMGAPHETDRELITGNNERVFCMNLDVIATAEELAGFSNMEQKKEFVKSQLNRSSWKWDVFKSCNIDIELENIFNE